MLCGYDRIGGAPGPGSGRGVVDAPVPREARSKVKIGLALGGGAARGWSHIGCNAVADLPASSPDVIAGCSIGAVVGGCYAAGKLDELEAFALSLTKRRVMGLLDFHLAGSGLIAGTRLQKLLDQGPGPEGGRGPSDPLLHHCDGTRHRARDLADQGTAREGDARLLRRAFSTRSSCPARWLMDGALVNPIPITAARALGAEIVICVNLNSEVRARGTVIQSYDASEPSTDEQEIEAAISEPRRWGIFARCGRTARRSRTRRASRP